MQSCSKQTQVTGAAVIRGVAINPSYRQPAMFDSVAFRPVTSGAPKSEQLHEAHADDHRQVAQASRRVEAAALNVCLLSARSDYPAAQILRYM
jgi:hypothetical protein